MSGNPTRIPGWPIRVSGGQHYLFKCCLPLSLWRTRSWAAGPRLQSAAPQQFKTPQPTSLSTVISMTHDSLRDKMVPQTFNEDNFAIALLSYLSLCRRKPIANTELLSRVCIHTATAPSGLSRLPVGVIYYLNTIIMLIRSTIVPIINAHMGH